MIEVAGTLIVAIFTWVITGMLTLAALLQTDDGIIQIFGGLAFIAGITSIILTLVGTGVITVI